MIFVSHTPKFWFQKSVDERGLWRHFLSYCRVTKSLTKLLDVPHSVLQQCEEIGHLSCTWGPPQPIAYMGGIEVDIDWTGQTEQYWSSRSLYGICC